MYICLQLFSVGTIPVKQKKQGIVSVKDFNLILRILSNNWWILLLVIPLFYAIGTLYVYRLTNVYKASSEILLKTNDTYYQGNVLTDASFNGINTYIDNLNEKRVIQSYDLADQVVSRLLNRLQVSYFIVGKVRTTEQFSGMPFTVKVESVNETMFEKNIDLDITNYNNFKLRYEENGQTQEVEGEFDKELVHLNFRLLIEREANFTKASAENLKNVFYQFVIHSKAQLIANIQQNLNVENPEYTNILRLELKDILPERAVLILDTLNNVYAQNRLKSKYELNERTIAYIDRQLNEIRYSLKSIEDTMQRYKEKKAIINLDWQQDDFLKKISVYDGNRSLLQLRLQAYDDLEKYIIENKDPQFLPPSVYVAEKEGFMSKAVSELYSNQIELNRLSGSVKEDNPKAKEKSDNVVRLRQNLLTYITNARKATKQEIASIEQEILGYINNAKMIPEQKRDILNIERKASVSEELYNFLLEKKASTEIARASIVMDIKIVEAPRSAGIDSPNKTGIQRNFISIGLLLAIIIIAIRVAFFTKIKTVEELKELTELPLVGVIPAVKPDESEGLIVDRNPNSLVSEAFRNLRTNLQYSNVDQNAKSFLITSFLPGEGKTFTSSNLAVILAKSGKKTVLIELDLHKPKVNQRFTTGRTDFGITTFINGTYNFEDLVTETEIENLYCIFAGPTPPNPSDYVLSERLKQIIYFAKQKFDYVIIDTPPAGLLSDSIYLVQFVDSAVFVLNTKTSTKKTLSIIEELIANSKITNASLVLNGLTKFGKRYYYQGYGYSYGYVYGQNAKNG